MIKHLGLGAAYLLLSIAALGCGGAEKEARLAAASTVAMGKAEPPPTCKLLSSYMAKDPKIYAPFASLGANSDAALRELRLKASDSGANYVVLEWVAGPAAQGRLYACPPDAIPAQGAAVAPGGPPPAPAAPACKPPCSPGYACVDGACVSACNPPCPAGKQCGADRTCH